MTIWIWEKWDWTGAFFSKSFFFWCKMSTKNLYRLNGWRFYLTLKVPNKNCNKQHFNLFLSSFEDNKAWFFMWILCLAEDSLKTLSYFLWKTLKKYLWMSSAAVRIGALKVNIATFKKDMFFRKCCKIYLSQWRYLTFLTVHHQLLIECTVARSSR